MENTKAPGGGTNGKNEEDKTAPWWVKYVFAAACAIGWFIKDIVWESNKTKQEMYDKLYKQQTRLIEVVDRSNNISENALNIIQKHIQSKSNDISNVDSTYYWHTDSAGNGCPNKK